MVNSAICARCGRQAIKSLSGPNGEDVFFCGYCPYYWRVSSNSESEATSNAFRAPVSLNPLHPTVLASGTATVWNPPVGAQGAAPSVPSSPPAADNIKRFETGAVRSADREGQRYDLISPIGLRRLAETCHEGAVKYSDFNWERGMPVSEMLNHAIAHIYNYLAGDRSEDHLAHAAWNLLGACHSEEAWPELNTLLRGPGCKPPVEEPADGGK